MYSIPFKTRALPLAIAACMVSASSLSLADVEELEEVIVTGSYIKGAVTDAASPVSIIDRDSLMQQGAPLHGGHCAKHDVFQWY